MDDETGGSLHERLGKLGPDALLHSLELLSSGSAPREEQDHGLATHVTKIKRSDGKINWSNSAHHIDRLIRAYDPWPGTFTFFPERSKYSIFQLTIYWNNNRSNAGVDHSFHEYE